MQNMLTSLKPTLISQKQGGDFRQYARVFLGRHFSFLEKEQEQ